MAVSARAAATAVDPEPAWFDDPVVVAARAAGDAGASARRSTPAAYRRQSIVLAAAALVLAVLGIIGANAITNATEEVTTSTGPVLVQTQSLRASLAEADAAAVAAFLTLPDEDPGQRRAYNDAIARATAQIEDIAARIGEDPAAHQTLQEINRLVVRYSGLVEAARASEIAGSPVSETLLVEAVRLLDGPLTSSADGLAEATLSRLDTQLSEERTIATIVVLLSGLVLVALLVAQVVMAQRTRRIINPLLAVATVLVLVAGTWFAAAFLTAQGRFDDAVDRAFTSILATASAQTDGYDARAAETVFLITADREARDEADAAIAALTDGELERRLGARADTERERSLAIEAQFRFDRYTRAVQQLRGASGAAADAIAIGPALQAFNGFNFTLDGLLADNREDFAEGLVAAADALRGLQIIALLLPLLAALAIFGGFQARISEYR